MSLVQNIDRLIDSAKRAGDLAESLSDLAKTLESSDAYELIAKLDELSSDGEQLERYFQAIMSCINNLQAKVGQTTVSFSAIAPISLRENPTHVSSILIENHPLEVQIVTETLNSLNDPTVSAQANTLLAVQKNLLQQTASLLPKTASGLMLLAAAFSGVRRHPVAQQFKSILEKIDTVLEKGIEEVYSPEQQLGEWFEHHEGQKQESRRRSEQIASEARQEADRKPSGNA
jgi:DNA polymerase III gamma/tau subunit